MLSNLIENVMFANVFNDMFSKHFMKIKISFYVCVNENY